MYTMDKNLFYNDLKKKIITEEIPPGTWLVERDLSIKYNISRTPVREVLRRLVSDGLMEMIHGKGYSVVVLSLERIVEIFQAREAVEGKAAYLSCIKGSEEFFNRIHELRKKLELLDHTVDTAAVVDLGQQLHDTIVEACNNSFLIEFYNKLKNFSHLIRNIAKSSIAFEEKSKKSHLILIRFLEQRDAEKSEACLHSHLRNSCSLLIKTFYKDLI